MGRREGRADLMGERNPYGRTKGRFQIQQVRQEKAHRQAQAEADLSGELLYQEEAETAPETRFEADPAQSAQEIRQRIE